MHKRFESRRRPETDEAFQELTIGSFADGLQKGDSVNVLDDLVHLRRHQVPSSASDNAHPLPLYYPQEDGLMHELTLQRSEYSTKSPQLICHTTVTPQSGESSDYGEQCHKARHNTRCTMELRQFFCMTSVNA